jgi:glycosyltransferase involved in cell wall biosynthesis
MSKCLFITWDGPQVSYLEGLFLPIFEGLAEHGHEFYILQFTWAEPERVAAADAFCRAAGVKYRAVRIRRWLGPIGPLVTAIRGAKHIRKAVRDWQIDTLMPRSLMPALATLAMRDVKGLRVIFDADGFSADEKVDFDGLSPRGLSYRILRDIEAQITRISDTVLTRTQAAIPILQARAGAGTDPSKYFVVTNGRSITPFHTSHNNLDVSRDPVICYVGSIGAKYCPETMLAVACAVRERLPNLEFKVFTGDGGNMERAIAKSSISDPSWITIDRVNPQDLQAHLAGCDVALSFLKPAFSTRGVIPTKLGDYLLAGLPIIGSEGVGNTQPLIDAGVFFASDGNNLDDIANWVSEIVMKDRPRLRDACRSIGEAQFSVPESVTRYLMAMRS